MACEICGKSTSSTAKKKEPADISFACRASEKPHPVWLHRLENGQTRFNLDQKFDGHEILVETLQGSLPKKTIALLRDLDRRGMEDDDVLDLVMIIWDAFPTMVANALAAKKP